MFIFSIYRLTKLELRWKVVQKYEKYVYVTFPLNPLSRKGDLLSLRSKSLCLFSLFIVCQNLNLARHSEERQRRGNLLFRVTDGDGAVRTHAFLDTKEVAYIVLSLGSIRFKSLAWTAIDMHPAAYKVHCSDCELDERS